MSAIVGEIAQAAYVGLDESDRVIDFSRIVIIDAMLAVLNQSYTIEFCAFPITSCLNDLSPFRQSFSSPVRHELILPWRTGSGTVDTHLH